MRDVRNSSAVHTCCALRQLDLTIKRLSSAALYIRFMKGSFLLSNIFISRPALFTNMQINLSKIAGSYWPPLQSIAKRLFERQATVKNYLTEKNVASTFGDVWWITHHA